MELTLPMNYEILGHGEMMYLDGGDAANFINNIKGAWRGWSKVSQGLRGSGWSWGTLLTSLVAVSEYGYYNAVAKLGKVVVKIGTILGGFIGGLIAGITLAAAVTYVWNVRLWY